MDVILDIDGTIADIGHRLPHIEGEKKNWDLFHKSCFADSPIAEVIQVVRCLNECGHRIIIVTGRPEWTRGLTVDWLEKYLPCHYEKLYMRPDGDYRADHEVKREILGYMLRDNFKPKISIDDRAQVVRMWRSEGIRCMQVAEGNY